MESDARKIYMQNIEDYVFDENRIVTYKWLSNVLSLHINISKLLLEDFLLEQSNKHPEVDFAVTYFVSGVSNTKNSILATIVDKKNLAKFKQSLNTVLSEHIYSIHRGSVPTDHNALFLASEHDDLCKGGIRNDVISKKTLNELAKMRISAQPKSDPPTVVPKVVSDTKGKENANKINVGFLEKGNVKKENGSIQKMFGAKEAANKSAPKADEKVVDVPASKPKKGGITGFFSKQANSTPVINVKPKIEALNTNESNITKNTEKVDKKKQEPETTLKAEIKTENKSPVKNNTNLSPDVKLDKIAKSNGKQTVKKYGKANGKKEFSKKRKRIQCLESDSDEQSTGEDDDIFAPSPEPVKPEILSDDEDVIPATPEISKPIGKQILNSRKRKKTVDKTFMKDGYILTVKEEVYESCSDNSDVEMKQIDTKKTTPKATEKLDRSPEKPAAKSKSKKKVSPPSQGKQSNMMNFFKKVVP